MKQANFHDTRMNFFKSSLEVDPMSFKVWPWHRESGPKGDLDVSFFETGSKGSDNNDIDENGNL